MELITNRTQAHVDRLNALRAKGWANLTDDEKAEWNGEASKGAYNYTDLNRVESAVAELSEMAGLGLTTKTNWTKADVPNSEDMSRYMGNLSAIMAACPRGTVFPPVPVSMSGLTYAMANNIEKMLLLAETALYRATHDLWDKFNCIFVEAYYQERTNPSGTGSFSQSAGIQFYRSYSFSRYEGYTFYDPVTFDPNTMTANDLVGLYMPQGHSAPYTRVEVVTAIKSATASRIEGIWKYVGYADYIPDTYLQGSTSYGQVENKEGAMPESGTLVSGSPSSDHCVLRVGGTLYYYSKIY